MVAAKALLPSMSLQELLEQPVEFFQDRDKIAKSVPDTISTATEFFQKLAACKSMEDCLGDQLREESQDLARYLKVVLASLSACAVLKAQDAEKAATFEEKKLKPRELTMDSIPTSIRTQLDICAKKK